MPYQLPCCRLRDGEPMSEYFRPVRIICIGRNYADHAREMGHDPTREPPFFFFKPITALARDGNFVMPQYSREVHHELEMLIALDQGGRNLSEQQARNCVGGFGLGLDMTCRDIQRQAKEAGRPWELAKGFDGSAPCTAIGQGSFDDLERLGTMTLTRNGELVQKGHWRDMIWSIPELLQHISRHIALQPGDLIFTGTPAGVGPVEVGDRLEARMEGFPKSLLLQVTKEDI